MIAAAHADIRVMKAVVDADVEMTPAVVNAVWKWFQDVELMVPLPVMDMSDKMRLSLVKDILAEMDEAFTRLDQRSQDNGPAEMQAYPEVALVDSLWRELAGCYADIVNAQITVLTPEEQEQAYEGALRYLQMTSDLDETEVLRQIKTDPALRMMLRRNGLDPDRFPQV